MQTHPSYGELPCSVMHAALWTLGMQTPSTGDLELSLLWLLGTTLPCQSFVSHSPSSRNVLNDFLRFYKFEPETQSHHVGLESQTTLAALPNSSCSSTPKFLTSLQYGSATNNLIHMPSNHATAQ